MVHVIMVHFVLAACRVRGVKYGACGEMHCVFAACGHNAFL
jgi:hypothetical protein